MRALDALPGEGSPGILLREPCTGQKQPAIGYDGAMPKRTWTPERHWASLVRAGLVDAQANADDLAHVAERAAGALAPTVHGGVRASEVRQLFDYLLLLLEARDTAAPDLGLAQAWIDLLAARFQGQVPPPLDPSQVRRFLGGAAQVAPRSVPVLLALGEALLDERRHAEAGQVLTKVLEIDAENRAARELLRIVERDPAGPVHPGRPS